MTRKVKLTMPGTKTVIVGALHEETERYVYMIPEGAKETNAFTKEDGWVVERVVEVPQKKGAVIQITGMVPFVRDYFGRGWIAANAVNPSVKTTGEVVSLGEQHGFAILFEGVDE